MAGVVASGPSMAGVVASGPSATPSVAPGAEPPTAPAAEPPIASGAEQPTASDHPVRGVPLAAALRLPLWVTVPSFFGRRVQGTDWDSSHTVTRVDWFGHHRRP